MNNERKIHWELVYENNEPTAVSWYQPVPKKSLELIRSTGAPLTAALIDVGGGASTLVDRLLDAGYQDASVLDISGKALERSAARLGGRASEVEWIESDITTFKPGRSYAIWHDRAVFHFLTEATDREKYIDVMRSALQPKGHFLLATFGPDGPLRCSGLEIRRYSIEALQEWFDDDFLLQTYEIEEHRTPGGGVQQFLYSWWQKRA